MSGSDGDNFEDEAGEGEETDDEVEEGGDAEGAAGGAAEIKFIKYDKVHAKTKGCHRTPLCGAKHFPPDTVVEGPRGDLYKVHVRRQRYFVKMLENTKKTEGEYDWDVAPRDPSKDPDAKPKSSLVKIDNKGKTLCKDCDKEGRYKYAGDNDHADDGGDDNDNDGGGGGDDDDNDGGGGGKKNKSSKKKKPLQNPSNLRVGAEALKNMDFDVSEDDDDDTPEQPAKSSRESGSKRKKNKSSSASRIVIGIENAKQPSVPAQVPKQPSSKQPASKEPASKQPSAPKKPSSKQPPVQSSLPKQPPKQSSPPLLSSENQWSEDYEFADLAGDNHKSGEKCVLQKHFVFTASSSSKEFVGAMNKLDVQLMASNTDDPVPTLKEVWKRIKPTSKSTTILITFDHHRKGTTELCGVVAIRHQIPSRDGGREIALFAAKSKYARSVMQQSIEYCKEKSAENELVLRMEAYVGKTSDDIKGLLHPFDMKKVTVDGRNLEVRYVRR
jgi:hypothetical protein